MRSQRGVRPVTREAIATAKRTPANHKMEDSVIGVKQETLAATYHGAARFIRGAEYPEFPPHSRTAGRNGWSAQASVG